MSPRTLILAFAALAAVVLIGWYGWNATHPTTLPITGESAPTGITATTTPAATSTSPIKQSDTAALNERISDFAVYITPLEVVSDSRCPADVQCIQAGEVVLKVKLEDATHSEIVTMHQGSPVAFGNKHVALMNVTPAKSSKTAIKLSDYRFTFSVAYGMGGEQATGTLSGTMTIGPVCPLERVDNPCKPTPEMYAAHKVAVYASDKKTLITTLTPNAQGVFTATLPVGTYYVAMATTQSGVGTATGVPTTLTIKDNTMTHLSIDIDTGIR
jgi:hypothetical protein